MTQPITPGRLSLLQLIAKQPGVAAAKLLSIKGVTAADLAYLTGLDLIREREAGCYHVTHMGSQVLKRSL